MADPKIEQRRKPGRIIIVFVAIFVVMGAVAFFGMNASHEQEQDEQQEMGLTPQSSEDAVPTSP